MIEDRIRPSRTTPFADSRTAALLRSAALLLLFLLIALALLGLNMRRGLNHDEHQFIASATLIERENLLPYRDFPYFHVPLLALFYAFLFQFQSSLLLTARLSSILFSLLGLWVIAASVSRHLRRGLGEARWLFIASGLLVLVATPLFVYTSGRAWNHDLPMLLMLASVVLFADTLVDRRPPGWLFLPGLLMGMASATRLSFAVIVIPFLLVLWHYPAFQARQRRNAILVFLIGLLAGGLPALIFFWLAPQGFWFGNVEYVRLNTLYYAADRMSLAGKFRFLGLLLSSTPANLMLPLLLLAGLAPLTRILFARDHIEAWDPGPNADNGRHFRLVFGLLLLLFALLAALAANPSQPQYYFPLFALMLLTALYAVSLWPPQLQSRARALFAAAALLALVAAYPQYRPGLEIVFQPDQWAPRKIHARGELLATLADRGDVLTLSPIPVLEGDAHIYPAFATGPFAWRVAPLLSDATQAQLGLPSPAAVERLWAEAPPRAILVGLDNDDDLEEAPLVEAASVHGYVPVALPDEGVLWLAPAATWNDAIRLGGHTLPLTPVQPGDSYVTTYYLQNSGPIPTNLNVLVRAIDQSENELFRADGWPWGSATSSWPAGAVWPHGVEWHVSEATPAGVYRVEMSFYDPATLEAFGNAALVGVIFVGDVTSLQSPPPVKRQIGEQIELLQVRVAETSLQAGQTLYADLVWTARGVVQTDYTVFVHLVAPDGRLAAQVDQPPLAGFFPTTLWPLEMPVVDSYALVVPRNAAPGAYQLHIGLYDPQNGERLPVAVDGQSAGAALVIPVQVE